MARITAEQARQFEGSGLDWLKLSNDGDTERVQFLMVDCADIPIFSTHKIKLNDKERTINCPREPEDSIDVCPLCASGAPTGVSRYILMYSHTSKKILVWERGPQFIRKLESLSSRYNPLSNMVFDIERNGAKGSTKTTYEVYAVPEAEPIDISQLDVPDLLGTIVMDKTPDEINEFLMTGNFPQMDNDKASSRQAPTRRRMDVNSQTVTRRSAPAAGTSSPVPTRRTTRRG